MENENSLRNTHLSEITIDNELVYILLDFEAMYL